MIFATVAVDDSAVMSATRQPAAIVVSRRCFISAKAQRFYYLCKKFDEFPYKAQFTGADYFLAFSNFTI
jgi:hypothetical protein